MKEFLYRQRHVVVLTVFLIVIVLIGGLLRDGAYVMPEFGDEDITIQVGKKSTIRVDYGVLERVTLQVLPDPTTLPGEKVKGSIRFGSGENEAWGKYVYGITTEAENCIVMETDADTVVFNYVNTEDTIAIFDMFREVLEDGGYTGIDFGD